MISKNKKRPEFREENTMYRQKETVSILSTSKRNHLTPLKQWSKQLKKLIRFEPNVQFQKVKRNLISHNQSLKNP